MNNEKLKELEALRARTAELEAEVAQARQAELRGLPAQFGFQSPEEFVQAFLAAAGRRRGRKPGVRTAVPKARKAKRSRAVITPEKRQEVKALVEAGKTGQQIAATVGISLPSVQNIKKQLGLVQARRAKKRAK